ncbi:MAG: spore germination protein [Peptococcaceae bacterium]|nr:spore germination protein [Peptococcaceae bacterium]
MEGGKISGTQLTFLMVWTIVSTGILFLPVTISRHVVQDAWLVAVFFAIGGLPMALVLSNLGLKFPEQTVIQYSQDILGKTGGKAVGLVLIWWFVTTNAITIRELAEFIVTVMPKTPVVVVGGVMILMTSFTLKSGLEVLGRVSEALFPVLFFSITLVIILVFKEADFKNLLPVFDNGVLPVIRATMTPVSYAGELVTMLMLVPFLNRSRAARKSSVLAILLVGAIGLQIESLSTAVFGELRKELLLPHFSLIQWISIANFIERLDAIFMGLIIVSIFLKIAVLQYCSVLSIAQWLNLRTYQPLIIPVGVITLALSVLMFDNVLDLIDFLDNIFPPYALTVEIGIPVLLLIASFFRPKPAVNTKKVKS